MASTSIHKISAAGYGNGKSELYDKARHRYHPQQLSYMYSVLSKKEDLNVAEMGVGTGLFTRALLADSQWDKAISSLRCIEPLESMRDVFAQSVQDPRVSISDGTFENSDIPDGWADVILAATAFHWCNDLEAASQEFNRILKPNGTVVFVWQLEDREKRWVDQMWILGEKYQKATGKTINEFKNWHFQKLFDLPSYKANFRDPEEMNVKYSTESTLEIVTTRYMTWSAIAMQSDDEKKNTAEELKAIVEKGEDLVWLNEAEGIFELPMSTPVVVIRRK